MTCESFGSNDKNGSGADQGWIPGGVVRRSRRSGGDLGRCRRRHGMSSLAPSAETPFRLGRGSDRNVPASLVRCRASTFIAGPAPFPIAEPGRSGEFALAPLRADRHLSGPPRCPIRHSGRLGERLSFGSQRSIRREGRGSLLTHPPHHRTRSFTHPPAPALTTSSSNLPSTTLCWPLTHLAGQTSHACVPRRNHRPHHLRPVLELVVGLARRRAARGRPFLPPRRALVEVRPSAQAIYLVSPWPSASPTDTLPAHDAGTSSSAGSCSTTLTTSPRPHPSRRPHPRAQASLLLSWQALRSYCSSRSRRRCSILLFLPPLLSVLTCMTLLR